MVTNSVARKLGGVKATGRRIETDADLIDAVRSGLPSRTLDFITADLA